MGVVPGGGWVINLWEDCTDRGEVPLRQIARPPVLATNGN